MGTPRRNGPSSPEEWLHLAVRYLARWDRAAAQVDRFLTQKGASPAQVRQAIARLSDLGYLDDSRYAQRWIERRLARKPLGRDRLKAELEASGVADALADRAIREAFRGVDEEELARRALAGRQRKGRRLTPVQVARLLRQWGFAEETIDRMIRDPSGHEGLDV